MKTIFQFLLVSALLALLSSCSNNIIEDYEIVSDKNEASTYDDVIETDSVYCFSYHGKTYKSNYTIIDSLIYFKDNKVNEIWNLLKERKNIAVLQREDGSIEYFDTYMQLEQELYKFNVQTRANSNSIYELTYAELACFKKDNYKGSSLYYEIDENKGWSTGAYSLIGTGFNDELTSFKLNSTYKEHQNSYPPPTPFPTRFGAKATFYGDIEYQGPSYTASVTFQNPYIQKSFKSVFFPETGQNWNDIISSFKLHT